MTAAVQRRLRRARSPFAARISPPSKSTALAAATLLCCHSARADLVAWWTFDESGGTTAADSSPAGASRPGALENGATFVPSGGRFGGAVNLDGIDDVVRVADHPDLEFALGTNPNDAASRPVFSIGGLDTEHSTLTYPRANAADDIRYTPEASFAPRKRRSTWCIGTCPSRSSKTKVPPPESTASPSAPPSPPPTPRNNFPA